MALVVRRVNGKRALEQFIRLPDRLPGQRPGRVPPLLADERVLHDPQRNLAAQGCEMVHWIAAQDGVPVGRVMGILHEPYNTLHGERTARFFQLDAVNDPVVVQALLRAVEAWARSLDADRIMGPDWATPGTFRFGASGLRAALVATIEGQAAAPARPTAY